MSTAMPRQASLFSENSRVESVLGDTTVTLILIVRIIYLLGTYFNILCAVNCYFHFEFRFCFCFVEFCCLSSSSSSVRHCTGVCWPDAQELDSSTERSVLAV